MKSRGGIYSLLALPGIYRFFGKLVLGDASRAYLSEYIRPEAGMKVLDIGCGPAEILDQLPSVNYLGFDINPKYIESAQKRFGGKGRFFCGDVGLTTIDAEAGSFDLALATGVLHHLDDSYAVRLLELASKALKPGGRLVTLDGCFVPQQPKLARFVVSRDRGEFVRDANDYVKLAMQVFPQVKPFIRHDLLRIPYTHIVMECSK